MKLELILDKNYITKLFQEKKDIYFPAKKNEKIVNIQIERVSPTWARKTCLAKYKLTFSDSSQIFIRATAKTDGSMKEVLEILENLYQNRKFSKKNFLVPQPLDYIKKAGALIYKDIKGVPLSLILEKKGNGLEKIFEDIAIFLFKFHSLKLKKIKRKSAILDFNDYKKIFRKIKKVIPQLSNYLISEKKIQFIKTIIKGRSIIHGDFYSGNILVDNKKIAIIDFDKTGLGNNLLDVATLHASLEFPKNVWPLKFSKRQIKKFQNIFLKKYYQLSNANIKKTKKELNKFIIKVFLDRIYFSALFLFNGWKEIDQRAKDDIIIQIKNLFLKIKNYLKKCQ